MIWCKEETASLSKAGCAYCQEAGLRPSRHGKQEPCDCVLRNIFRECLRRFVECAGRDSDQCRTSIEKGATRSVAGGWGRKDEEYMADFCLIAKRVLDAEEYRVFRFHFMLGADHRLCCRQMKMDRATFFRLVYRIERKLGKAFGEIEPYPLFPVNDYFSGASKTHSARVIEIAPEPKRPVARLNPSLRKAA